MHLMKCMLALFFLLLLKSIIHYIKVVRMMSSLRKSNFWKRKTQMRVKLGSQPHRSFFLRNIRQTHINRHTQGINLKTHSGHWHIHPHGCTSFAMENITPALCLRSAHIPSPFSPLSPAITLWRQINHCDHMWWCHVPWEWKGGACRVHLLRFVEHSSALTFAWLSDGQ